MPEIINYETLIVVEGKDEINFFEALLKFINFNSSYKIENCEGKSNIRTFIRTAKFRPNFDSMIKNLIIVRDADDDYKGAFTSVSNILKDNGFIPPYKNMEFSSGSPKVGIFIMPGASDNGMLEDLCLSTVSDHFLMKCVDSFIQCAKDNYKSKGIDVLNINGNGKKWNISKAKCQAFLSLTPDIYNSCGIAAMNKVWDFSHNSLEDLKSFLKKTMAS